MKLVMNLTPIKMKSHRIEITFFLWVLTIVLIHLLVGCSFSRNMNKEKTSESVSSKTTENTTTNADRQTNTTFAMVSKTNIVENVNTVISSKDIHTGNPKIDSFLKNNPFDVPVVQSRTTNKEEYSNITEEKKEKETIVQNKEATEDRKSDKLTKAVQSEGKNFSIIPIVIAAVVLIVLLFVFVWKRNLFARLWDEFISKSP